MKIYMIYSEIPQPLPWQFRMFIDWMFVSPHNSHVKILTLNVMIKGGEALGRWLGREGGAFMMGLHECSVALVMLFVIPWTIAHQAPLSMGFPRKEYWRGSPSFSRRSSSPRDQTCNTGKIFNVWGMGNPYLRRWSQKNYCYDLCQRVFCLCLLPWVLYLQVLHVNPQYLWAILCLNHFQHKLTPASILNCHECGSLLSSWVVSWLFTSLLGMIVIIVVYICLTVPSEKAMAPHSSTLGLENPMDGEAW